MQASTMTPKTETDWLDKLAFQHSVGRSLVLFFDYDGTLTPIVAHPSLAIFPEPFRDLLYQFQELDTVQLGFVSGRALDDLQQMVNVKPTYYSGSGGLEIDLKDQILHHESIAKVAPTLESLQKELQPILDANPYTWIERKPGAMTVHYRGIPPIAAIDFRHDVEHVLNKYSNLRWRVVTDALEITPAKGWDKGDAVEIICKHLNTQQPADWFPVYFGNACNDEEGMEAVLGLGGLSIGIGPEAPTNSQHLLPDPTTLMRRLEGLLERLK